MLNAALLPYVLFFLVAGIPALVFSRRWNKIAWPVTWLVFVVFIGLRHRIGGDWGNYVRKADYVSDLTLLEALSFQDPLFSLLSWVSSGLGFGVYGTNLVGAIIFCTGLFSYCARQPNRWLALCAATPFLVVASVMGASRQGVALGIFLLVVSFWEEWSLKKRVLGIVIAGFFHASAFIMLILTIVDLRMSVIRKGMLAVIIGPSALWLMNLSDTGLGQYTRIYVLEQSVQASGVFLHVSLNLLPAIGMLLTGKWWQKKCSNWSLLRILCLMSIALAALSPFFTQAVSRMSLYLFPISITFFAYLPMMVKSSTGRSLVRLGSVTLLLAVLTVWVGYSNQSFAYLPYQNVITTNSSDLDLR